MSDATTEFDVASVLQQIDAAVQTEKITESAAENMRVWLTSPRYAVDAAAIVEHIQQEKWQELDNVFWTVIPFGTGGRRGRMYPFGSNAINRQTIGESAKGLADYVKQFKPDGPWSCAIGYDTRHRSRDFAELCAGILVNEGFTVYFIDDYRSTPELSYLIRYKNCDCGIMVTASHNPPSDNAVKVYWSNGAQLVPPHDAGVIDRVEQVQGFLVDDFEPAVEAGKVILCREETDEALLKEHVAHSLGDSRDLKVIYSPLHGVGEFNVKNLFDAVGFNDLEIFEPHREPNGDFPNVPGHVSNPENPAVFDAIIERAQSTGANLILATDPDCDRMGAAAPLTLDSTGPWKTFNGNQLGALLADFVLRKMESRGELRSSSYLITTLVTTMLIPRIAKSYGVTCHNENLVGFKWICNLMDELGPEQFVFGTEESHGFLVGEYCRDKDGAIACLLMTELAAEAKAEDKTVHQKLDQLYLDHGYHSERLLTIQMEGSDGMKRMQRLMNALRDDTPWQLGDFEIDSIRDYESMCRHYSDGSVQAISGPEGNLIFLETNMPGNYVGVRPSGTEPKIKLYMFGFEPPESLQRLEDVKMEVEQRMDRFESALRTFAEGVE